MPKGYVIANYRTIHDPDGMADYATAAPPVLREHGGRVIVAQMSPDELEGGAGSAMVVLIEFDSVAAAHAWYESPGYGAARKFRQASSDCDITIVSGLDTVIA
ncbi:DUF1330 domain-containing protein [Rhodococcus sp. NPDC003318]|uniref:DUF1330 domain-containing protein n=1 Tax=Rhodococcus sp. NPDC003318 TaxID=3364503 RepID=UPI00369B202C